MRVATLESPIVLALAETLPSVKEEEGSLLERSGRKDPFSLRRHTGSPPNPLPGRDRTSSVPLTTLCLEHKQEHFDKLKESQETFQLYSVRQCIVVFDRYSNKDSIFFLKLLTPGYSRTSRASTLLNALLHRRESLQLLLHCRWGVKKKLNSNKRSGSIEKR